MKMVEMDVRSEDAYELARKWFDEVVFTMELSLKEEPDIGELKERVRELRGEYGKIALLVITERPSLIKTLRQRIGKVLLYVQGGNLRVVRYAIETGVDAIIGPWLGRRDPGFDHVLARLAAKKGVAVGFPMGPLLRASPYERATMLKFMARVWRLVDKYGVPRFLTSSAGNRWEVRGPRELMSLGIALGMDPAQAKASLSFYPLSLLERLK
ncbi:Ribonuclease P protein component 3 [Pyrococcus yayanosii]|uniref:Ribonuclease P protein component 3 n=1 Tax=Pyrococcus yayanosii (strain CH1 / JCM 16557) TaxID=529709 RepID=F8AJ73_PYRYC|nr:Ribonuclease P protein component 3 [Pyrococcus yayanosii]AEH24514.1 ribonuclease P protein component 3 [Pyrococcus yayanosii CH1]